MKDIGVTRAILKFANGWRADVQDTAKDMASGS
jgi:hypothetical protein